MDKVRKRHLLLFLVILVLIVALFGVIFVVLNNFNMELRYLHNEIDRVKSDVQTDTVARDDQTGKDEEENVKAYPYSQLYESISLLMPLQEKVVESTAMWTGQVNKFEAYQISSVGMDGGFEEMALLWEKVDTALREDGWGTDPLTASIADSTFGHIRGFSKDKKRLVVHYEKSNEANSSKIMFNFFLEK